MTKPNRETIQIKLTHPELVDYLHRRCAEEFMSPTEYVKRLLVADRRENRNDS
jgi:hypothetical protein